MPIPLAISAGLGLVSTGMGLYDMIKGGQSKRKAIKATEKFGRKLEDMRVKNMMADLKVPTRGIELAKEAQAQRYATGVGALQAAGAEAVIGGLPQMGQQQTKEDLALSAQLEKMEYARDLQRAQAEQRVEEQNVGAQRQLGMMRLQGAGLAAGEGAQRQQAGLGTIVGGLGQAASLYLENSPLYGKDTTSPGGIGQSVTDLGGLRSGQAEYENLQALRGGQSAYGAMQQPASSPTYNVYAQRQSQIPSISPLQPIYGPEYQQEWSENPFNYLPEL